jgi:hypothetical protein
MTRGILLAQVLGVLGCSGPAPIERAPDPSRSPPAETVVHEPPVSADPEAEAVLAWVRDSPGRADATVRIVERRHESYCELLRVAAVDGDHTFDAWVEWRPSSPHADAARRFWRVAEVVAAAARERVDTLLRSHGRAIATVEGRTLFCEDDSTCRELSTTARIATLRCPSSDDHRCTLGLEDDSGRIGEWEIEGARWRLVRSFPIARPLGGPWDADVRSERGSWIDLQTATERPLALDAAALAPPTRAEIDTAVADDVSFCEPTVRSLRDGTTVTRVASCGEPDPLLGDPWPAAFMTSRGDTTVSAPLFVPSSSPPVPERAFAIADLAGPGAIGVVASSGDGGSPGGHSTEDLWVLVPTSHGLRAHSVQLSFVDTIGLGTEDEHEGYVVGVTRERSMIEIVGPGSARYTGCERWDGTHARRSDRWRGARRVHHFELPISFDSERGFEIAAPDQAILREQCTGV